MAGCIGIYVIVKFFFSSFMDRVFPYRITMCVVTPPWHKENKKKMTWRSDEFVLQLDDVLKMLL